MEADTAAEMMCGCQDDLVLVVQVTRKVRIDVADEMRGAFQNGVQTFVLAVKDDEIGADIDRIREMDAELPARIS